MNQLFGLQHRKGQTLLCLNLSLVYSLTVGKVTNYFLTLYA